MVEENVTLSDADDAAYMATLPDDVEAAYTAMNLGFHGPWDDLVELVRAARVLRILRGRQEQSDEAVHSEAEERRQTLLGRLANLTGRVGRVTGLDDSEVREVLSARSGCSRPESADLEQLAFRLSQAEEWLFGILVLHRYPKDPAFLTALVQR